jgi:hypothetical protein
MDYRRVAPHVQTVANGVQTGDVAGWYVGQAAIGRRLGCNRKTVAKLRRDATCPLPMIRLPMRRAKPFKSRYAWMTTEALILAWLVARARHDARRPSRRRGPSTGTRDGVGLLPADDRRRSRIGRARLSPPTVE